MYSNRYQPEVFAVKIPSDVRETDRAKYVAIGESDRMTLKFVKPAS